MVATNPYLSTLEAVEQAPEEVLAERGETEGEAMGYQLRLRSSGKPKVRRY